MGPIERRAMNKTKKVLCVCDMNLRRSPSAQVVLCEPPFNFDTRSAGTIVAALVKLRPTLLNWADEIVCMEEKQAAIVREMKASNPDTASSRRFSRDRNDAKIIILNIPDIYKYRDPELMKLISERYSKQMDA